MTTETPDGEATKLLPRDRRFAAGKALRAVVSRESHADFAVDPQRDPLAVLTASDGARIPELVPERYWRMHGSPFAFYRGAAALMAHDLAAKPRIGLPVQACGDCHLMNFGVFSSPEDNILFDINDFDETHPDVDFIVDLKRLTTSVAVAAQDAGLSDKKAEAIARSTAESYRLFMHGLAQRSPLEVWRTTMDLKSQMNSLDDRDLETQVLATMMKAERKGKQSAETPALDDTGLAFKDKPGSIYHVLPGGTAIHPLSAQARSDYVATLLPERAILLGKYALRDVAFKIVGVGSVGTYCAIGLWTTEDGETMVLQLKQAWESAIAPLAGTPYTRGSQGHRVVDGQRALQAAADAFLGWTHDDGRDFYLRRLKNRRLGDIAEAIETKALSAYAMLCGRTLARAHARTGDPAMIAGYLGASETIDAALASFAMAYASQTVLDHAKLAASPLVPKASPLGKA